MMTTEAGEIEMCKFTMDLRERIQKQTLVNRRLLLCIALTHLALFLCLGLYVFSSSHLSLSLSLF